MSPPNWATPLSAAAMACSRTPKCTLRPAKFARENTPAPLSWAKVDSVRSAAPPKRLSTRRLARGQRLARSKARQPLVPARGQLARLRRLEAARQLGIDLRIARVALAPDPLEPLAPLPTAPEVRPYLLGHVKLLLLGPAPAPLNPPQLLCAQRLAVRRCRTRYGCAPESTSAAHAPRSRALSPRPAPAGRCRPRPPPHASRRPQSAGPRPRKN